VGDRPKLIVHGVDPKRWCEVHGFTPFTAPCQECGLPLTTSLPMVWGKLRGMRAPVCVCGNTRTPYGVVLPEELGDLP